MPNLIEGGSKTALALKAHLEEALARNPRYLSEKPKFLAVLMAFVEQAQEIETALQDILNDRTLAGAVGDQLDQLGGALGQVRGGLADEVYRLFIRARILVNRSSGTIPQLVAVFALVANAVGGEAPLPKVYDGGNAHVIVDLTRAEQDPALIPFFLQFLSHAKAGGVRAILEWSEVPITEAFRYDTGPGYDVGHYASAEEV